MALKRSQSWQIVENSAVESHLIFRALFKRDDSIKNTLLALASDILDVHFAHVHTYVAPADTEPDDFGILNMSTKSNLKSLQLGLGFANAIGKTGTNEEVKQWLIEQYDN